MQSPRALLGPGIVVLLTLVAGGWFLQQGIAQDRGSLADSRLFQEVLDHIADRYVDSIDRDSLYASAIQGILTELGDPNTSLMNGETFENFRLQTEGDYGGVGLEISDRDDFITVVSPLPGTPGARAGIRAGDEIVAVDGVSTRDWPVQQAVQVLRGTPGTDAQVQIVRPGVGDPIDFTITRERIQLLSVPFATLLEGDIGYVPLGLFSETSTAEVRAAADSLRDAGATSFILDLRGNPGGILDQGVGITDLFLPSGASVVETRGRDGLPNGALRASTPDRYEGMPVVVLVDRGSASASEIVAGALQDHDRALVLGTTTFGKGSVQSLYPLSNNYVLKMTTARWYTPQGRSIEREDGEDLDPINPVALTEGTEHLPITVTGAYVLPPDTAGRPTVTSAGGRTLFGGGGIVPDVLAAQDTLTAAEQEATRALSEEWGSFSLGLFSYAVGFLNAYQSEDPNFVITDADLVALHEHLRTERELELDLETFLRAEPVIRYELETEIAGQGWDALEGFRRTIRFDTPLQQALALLREADSPEDLFSLGASGTPPVGLSLDAGAGL
ncbi:MAG: S41 family peptidase [Gemmatimonadota bacterium]